VVTAFAARPFLHNLSLYEAGARLAAVVQAGFGLEDNLPFSRPRDGIVFKGAGIECDDWIGHFVFSFFRFKYAVEAHTSLVLTILSIGESCQYAKILSVVISMRYGDKIPNLPTKLLFLPAAASSMDGIAFGAYCAFVLFYWRNGRRALPSSDRDLAILARLSPNQFRKVKADVMSALAAILPELEKAWDAWASNQVTLSRLAQVGLAQRRAYRMERAAGNPTPVEARPKRTETQRRIAVEKRQVGAVFVD
jgi:uncharacterized protein YdaU (DUF1376 family)